MIGNARHLARFIGGAGAALALAFAAAFATASAPPTFASPLPSLQRETAWAEEIDTNPSADALQLEVERTAAAYDGAVTAAEAAGASLEENQARLAELEAQIPVQQARSDAAARELYKFEQQRLGVIDLLLSADTFFDFMSNLDYINRITATNVAEISRLNEMKSELDSQQAELERVKSEADARAAEAERALTAAQEARLEAQRKAAEAARQAAEADAAARAAAGGGAGAAGGSPSTADAAAAADAVVNDDADWTSDEGAFVDSWAVRIDAYLDGSPLAGQGRSFAQAAWNYGVDPRWSPAIAYLESSLGAYCFMPHNAWGWGAESWRSWEEAIDAHVRGLARGYGYTISWDAARKYCPPNADHWYNVVLAQMNSI